jgi:hypothetical protein
MRTKDFSALISKRLKELGLSRAWEGGKELTGEEKKRTLNRIKTLKEARRREELTTLGYRE